MYESSNPEMAYPRSIAFVIRFHSDAKCSSKRCSGRIERVTDFGASRTFFSLSELLTLLADALDESATRET